ncbi:hypothetical protein DMUE_2340 [Dictyocoela muelleri]|nr:hypothetical protein DMUE_2340 [Dictyocoela muelleri]
MYIKYQKRKSVRTYSKFEKMNISLKTILKVIIKYCCGLSRMSILKSVELLKPCLSKILSILINEMIIDNQNLKKMDLYGSIVQIDETVLNFKSKSHRVRMPLNKTDALVIVEVNNIVSQIYAEVIENKKKETIMPIECDHVVKSAEIHTDEHKSYNALVKKWLHP